MLCGEEMKGFKCVCGWKRVYHTFLAEFEEATMEGVGSMVKERTGNVSGWVPVPAGLMMVVDDVEV